ncbi:prolyl oligopeptidase [Syncephalis plumigaleata]|nr:prolyl oligopeptidase [Syncephalis plumigaleata]
MLKTTHLLLGLFYHLAVNGSLVTSTRLPFVAPYLAHLPNNATLPTLNVSQQLFMTAEVKYHPEETRIRQPLDLDSLQSLAVALNNKKYETLKDTLQQRLMAVQSVFESGRSTTLSTARSSITDNNQSTLSLTRLTTSILGPLGGIGRLQPAQEARITIILPEELDRLKRAGIDKKEIDDIAIEYYITETIFWPVCLIREILPSNIDGMTPSTISTTSAPANEVWYMRVSSRQWISMRDAVEQRLKNKIASDRAAKQQPPPTDTELHAIFDAKAFQPHLLVAATYWTPALEQQVGQRELPSLAYFAVLIGSAVPLHALPTSQVEQVPVAKTKPFQHKYHGEVIDDPYQWIKDEGQDSTDVKAYLDAEKVYAQQVLAKDQQLKDQIHSELVKTTSQYPTMSSQYIGNYRYYSKRQPDTKYLGDYRKKIDVANAPEELILDLKTLPDKSEMVSETKPNSDHTLFAFTTYNPISGKHNLLIKDLNSKQMLPDKIENIAYWFEWSSTGKSILYTANDPNGARLMRHTVGTSTDKDSAIHTGQKGFYISVKKSSSNQYFFITISKKNVKPQYFYLDATNDTASKLVPIPVTLSPKSSLQVYHLNKQFLLVAEPKDTKKKTAYVCDIDKINDKSAHKRVLENVKLEISSIAAFRNHIVLFDQIAVPQQVTVYDYDSEGRLQPNAKSHNIEFPNKSYRAPYKGVAITTVIRSHLSTRH